MNYVIIGLSAAFLFILARSAMETTMKEPSCELCGEPHDGEPMYYHCRDHITSPSWVSVEHHEPSGLSTVIIQCAECGAKLAYFVACESEPAHPDS